MEVIGRRAGIDDKTTQGHECSPCREDSVSQQAYGYCINCKEYLCETCYKCHRKPKPFRDHILVENDTDKNQSEQDEDERPPPVPERKKIFHTKCNNHRNEDLKYRCRTHEEIVCSVCAITQHKECENLDYIPEICESENALLIETIEYVEGKVKYKLKQENDALQSAEKSHELALSAIKTQREQVIRYFEETEKHFSYRILRYREKSKQRETELLECDQKLKAKKSLMTKEANGSEIEKYLSIQRAGKDVNDINIKVPGVFGHPSLELSYEPRHPLPALGKANVEEQQGDVSTKKMKLLRTVNIAGEKTLCSIFDGTILSESPVSLLLVDCLNERLILISNSRVIDFYQCSSEPRGVTMVSNREVAVSFPAIKEVQFFTIGETISSGKRKSIEFSDMPEGIRYHRSGCSLVICFYDDNRSRLESWSLDGMFLRSVASFDFLTHMTHISNKKILLSCSINHSVFVLDMDGTVMKTFQFLDDNMNGPYGVVADANENIYVCGQSCLRKVSNEGKWEQILSREDGYAPQSVLVGDKTNKVFVGQAEGKGCNDVLVFQM